MVRRNNSSTAALAFGLIAMTLVGQCYAYGGLSVGFYSGKCKNIDVEKFIREKVESAFKQDPTLVAAMLRMLFHDCFVRGCDASLLLDGENTEKTAGPNRTVRGFELIDDIKRALEDEYLCPGVVSCADIIVIVTRVTVYLASGGSNWYKVETGRRDGVISLASEANALPSPNVPVHEAISKFQALGLSAEDFVLLLGGGHTVGIAHCALFQNRLYNFNGNPGSSDPEIEPDFLQVLKTNCPQNGTMNNFVNLDQLTPNSVDNGFYNAIQKRLGVLQVDQDMASDPATSQLVNVLSRNNVVFNTKFGVALNNMAKVGVLTGTQGQIRATCRMINKA